MVLAAGTIFGLLWATLLTLGGAQSVLAAPPADTGTLALSG